MRATAGCARAGRADLPIEEFDAAGPGVIWFDHTTNKEGVVRMRKSKKSITDEQAVMRLVSDLEVLVTAASEDARRRTRAAQAKFDQIGGLDFRQDYGIVRDVRKPGRSRRKGD